MNAIILNKKVKRKGRTFYLARVGWCLASTAYVPLSWMKKNKIDIKGKETVSVSY